MKKCRRYVYSFRQNTRTWRTDRRADTARRHRPRFHSIVRQKRRWGSLAVINKVQWCVAIVFSVWCDILYQTVETVDDTPPVADTKARLVENHDFCLPHLHPTPPLESSPSEYCHNLWYGKTTEQCGYPIVEIIRSYVYSFRQNTNVTNGQTGWRSTDTARRHIGRTYS